MLGLGIGEIAIILIVAIIVIGPDELPAIAKKVGKFVTELKRTTNMISSELQSQIDLDLTDAYGKKPNPENNLKPRDQPLDTPTEEHPYYDHTTGEFVTHTSHAATLPDEAINVEAHAMTPEDVASSEASGDQIEMNFEINDTEVTKPKNSKS